MLIFNLYDRLTPELNFHFFAFIACTAEKKKEFCGSFKVGRMHLAFRQASEIPGYKWLAFESSGD